MQSKAPVSDPLLASLRSVFGYDSFRPLQHEIIGSILADRDTFVLMPTGGGKSLCYQLPALLRDGLTVVVSPLIALMQDQVDRLRNLGLAATFINSSLDAEEADRRQHAITQGQLKLLYVAPERLMMPAFLKLLARTPISCFAIDEAHCISEWGHDFRPDYRELRRLRELFPRTPIAAFTATATPRVQADITQQLALRQPTSFRGSFNRANLFYEVRPKERVARQISDYLRNHRGESGIIYCFSRKGTEELAAALRDSGFSAAAYHAGLEAEERRAKQEAFTRNAIKIIVATIAFGMGIDKPDVRFVIHADMPRNLEGYYQESGRAGRDGHASECILFFSPGDVAKHTYFIDQKPSRRERQIAFAQLEQMAAWATTTSCRRRSLLAYFDERFEGQQERCCDLCRQPLAIVDRGDDARLVLACVEQTGERYGLAYIHRVLTGSRDHRIQQAGHDQLSLYGAGSHRDRSDWRQLIQDLVQEGYLLKDPERFNALRLTKRGRAALAQQERVLLPKRETSVSRSQRQSCAEPRATESSTEKMAAAEQEVVVSPELFEQLRALRTRLAAERDVPPYVIAHDAMLRGMAATLPASLHEFEQIRGIGPRKATDIGAAFLAVIERYRQARDHAGAEAPRASAPTQPVRSLAAQTEDPAPGMPSPPDGPRTTRQQPAAKRAGLAPSERLSLDLWRQGRSVSEIARQRQLSPVTIEEHITQAISLGEIASLERLVPTARIEAIRDAIAAVGADRLKPIREYLGEEYSYAEIRYARALLTRGSE